MLRGLGLKSDVTHRMQRPEEMFIGFTDENGLAKVRAHYGEGVRALREPGSKAPPQYQPQAVFVPTVLFMKAYNKLMNGTIQKKH